MKYPAHHKSHSGLTLVELMVGVAVIGIVVAAAVPSLYSLLERRRVIAAAGEISSMFAYARSEANVTGSELDMHMEPVPSEVGQFSCIRLVATGTGDTCQCSRVVNTKICRFGSTAVLREYLLPKSDSVTFEASATWSAAANYVVSFSHNTHFMDVQNVQVLVKGIRTGAQLRVDYNNVGRIRICSPDSSVAGFAQC